MYKFPWNKGNFGWFSIINIWDTWHSQLEMLLGFFFYENDLHVFTNNIAKQNNKIN